MRHEPRTSIVFAAACVLVTLSLPVSTHAQSPPNGPPATIRVPAGGDLQAALDRARAGDLVELAPGAVYRGNFVLRPKDGTRPVTLRTTPSTGLPRAGARISPDHSRLLATIQSPNTSPALRTAPGAHRWRLTLLEFGPNARGAGDILVLGDGSAAQSNLSQVPRDLLVDRCYIRGDPLLGQKRGIALNSASTRITNSYIADIKAAGQDAQAIAGWNGPGPFVIENNYLEASGENFLLGGTAPAIAGLVPSDVVFRRNHVTRPVSWRGQRWTVKNLFELKNARRVLVEGNLFEHNWQGGQPGYAVVLTPSGQRGQAPWSTVEDVTFRWNIIRHVAAVFNLLAFDDNGESALMRRIRIGDNLIYGVDRAAWGGNGAFLQVGEGPVDLVVEHNTIIQSGNVITAYGGTRDRPAAAVGFIFRNNLALHNANGVIGQGRAIGSETLAAYFPGAEFVRNVLAGGRESRYPGDNLFPEADQFAAQFVNYAAHDYRLQSRSTFRRAATSGADLGVSYIVLARALGARAREWLGLK